jgi:hypothetical protein
MLHDLALRLATKSARNPGWAQKSRTRWCGFLVKVRVLVQGVAT